ncbi:MAG: fused MFS/spermidine synthase, partial [Deltaproteobacteria bacterium]|nr:fused MFS/spermidine synthase [Deltaproteobacteria bacterium]MBW2532466.1 fused MFS/spermidine synthase [Deltaproteobacteria bacterium]
SWIPSGAEQPTLHLLAILSVSVGPSFFALSATSPLLQAWFHRRFPGRSPYPLYAVSNAGSLLAVFSYPLVVEPLMGLGEQETAWFCGFVLFAVGCAVAGLGNWSGGDRRGAAAHPVRGPGRTAGTRARPLGIWIGLSALGSLLLLATTAQISQDVAASPLFWVVPLGLYLTSFVVCFAGDRWYHRRFWLGLLPLAALGVAAQLLFASVLPVAVQLTIHAATLFAGCMVCHGELARARPDASRLTGFYLAISLGGVLGGIFVALVAPLVFPGLWEFSLGWLALYTLVLVLLGREGDIGARRRFSVIRVLLGAGWVAAALCFVTDMVFDHREATITSRGFYGPLAVSEKRDWKCLYNGRIRHGCQWTDAERSFEPTTYYGPGSGVAVAVAALRESRGGDAPLGVAVIGLGVGTCAAWGTEGDAVRFYEIDGEVVRLARTHFTYLRDASAATDVVVRDGRLALEREHAAGERPYDLLVLDAFLGDAVPLHLLTREAFEIYAKRLATGGALAAHISNRHVDLKPLMRGLAAEAGLEAFLVRTGEDLAAMTYESTWVILTGSERVAAAVRASGEVEPWGEGLPSPVVFTDQHSNLLELL